MKNILILLFLSTSIFSQEKKPELKDGWYIGYNQCTYQRILGANTRSTLSWIEVKNKKIVYIGKGKTKSKVNNFLENKDLIEIPFVLRNKKKGLYATYKVRSGVDVLSRDNVGYIISCKVKINQFMETSR